MAVATITNATSGTLLTSNAALGGSLLSGSTVPGVGTGNGVRVNPSAVDWKGLYLQSSGGTTVYTVFAKETPAQTARGLTVDDETISVADGKVVNFTFADRELFVGAVDAGYITIEADAATGGVMPYK